MKEVQLFLELRGSVALLSADKTSPFIENCTRRIFSLNIFEEKSMIFEEHVKISKSKMLLRDLRTWEALLSIH